MRCGSWPSAPMCKCLASCRVLVVAMAGTSKRRRNTTTPSHHVATASANMHILAFQSAASQTLKLSTRYVHFPDAENLTEGPASNQLLNAIVVFLHDIPRRHRRTWTKMLRRAYPELNNNNTLDQLIHKLVLRCWRLRNTSNPSILNDAIEFCAGEGNLTMQCLEHGLVASALDLKYHPDHNMITRVGLRLMIDCISETKPGALNWWGTRCSSFVSISKHCHMLLMEFIMEVLLFGALLGYTPNPSPYAPIPYIIDPMPLYRPLPGAPFLLDPIVLYPTTCPWPSSDSFWIFCIRWRQTNLRSDGIFLMPFRKAVGKRTMM